MKSLFPVVQSESDCLLPGSLSRQPEFPLTPDIFRMFIRRAYQAFYAGLGIDCTRGGFTNGNTGGFAGYFTQTVIQSSDLLMAGGHFQVELLIVYFCYLIICIGPDGG
jgi:hypothetical protein